MKEIYHNWKIIKRNVFDAINRFFHDKLQINLLN